MDLAAINDITQLKALAYDQLALKEQTENNLALINQRIRELNVQNHENMQMALAAQEQNGGTPDGTPKSGDQTPESETTPSASEGAPQDAPPAPVDETAAEETNNGSETGNEEAPAAA